MFSIVGPELLIKCLERERRWLSFLRNSDKTIEPQLKAWNSA